MYTKKCVKDDYEHYETYNSWYDELADGWKSGGLFFYCGLIGLLAGLIMFLITPFTAIFCQPKCVASSSRRKISEG